MNRQIEVYFRIVVLALVLPQAAFGMNVLGLPGSLTDSIPVPKVDLPSPALVSIDKSVLDKVVVTAPVVELVAGAFYRWTIAAADKRNQLVKHTDPRYQLVKDVFEDITQTAKRSSYSKAASAFDWEINLIDDPSKQNAYAWPGGKVVVYSGIFEVARNKAGLATVLGHEILHSLAGHAVKRFDPAILKTLSAAEFAGTAALDPDKLPPATVAAITAILMLEVDVKFSAEARKQELEADYEGMHLAALTGYDPEEGILYWSRQIPHAATEQERSILDNHPDTLDRYQQLMSRMGELQVVYSEAKTMAKGKDKSLELLSLATVRK